MSDCEEIVIVQLRSRAGFSELLTSLSLLSDQKRLSYSVEEIPVWIFSDAQRMKKVTLPHKSRNRTGSRDDDSENCWDRYLRIPSGIVTNHSPTTPPLSLLSSHETLTDVLKTPREEYCLLRIWRCGQPCSSLISLEREWDR
jgi:hypothetical protein